MSFHVIHLFDLYSFMYFIFSQCDIHEMKLYLSIGVFLAIATASLRNFRSASAITEIHRNTMSQCLTKASCLKLISAHVQMLETNATRIAVMYGCRLTWRRASCDSRKTCSFTNLLNHALARHHGMKLGDFCKYLRKSQTPSDSLKLLRICSSHHYLS